MTELTIPNQCSLSNLWTMNQEADCGFITAYRQHYRAEQNIKRNASLFYKLMDKQCKVIVVKSDFMVNVDQEINALPKVFKHKGVDNHPKPHIQDEELHGYFVISKPGTDLKHILITLAEFFEQDSVLYMPQESEPVWIATNRSEDNFIQPLGAIVCYNNGEIPKGHAFFTSYIDAKPLYFNETDGVMHSVEGRGWAGHFRVHTIAKQHWSDLDHA